MRKKQSWMIMLVMIASFVSNACAQVNYLSDSMPTPVWNEIQRMQNDFRSGQITKMAHWITYPYILEAPIKAIEDSAEFVARADEVLDIQLIDKIGNSKSTDWIYQEFEPVPSAYLYNGTLCFVDGRIHSITYKTAYFEKKRKQAIDSLRALLGSNLANLTDPVLQYWTPSHYVLIDQLPEGLRYTAWPLNVNINTPPEMTINSEIDMGFHMGFVTRSRLSKFYLQFYLGELEITICNVVNSQSVWREIKKWRNKNIAIVKCGRSKDACKLCMRDEDYQNPPSKKTTENFAKVFQSGDYHKISELFVYPVELQSPVPAISDTAEMRVRLAEVIDSTIANRLKGATSKDWMESGVGAILTGGSVALNSQGKIIAVLSNTQAWQQHKNDTLEKAGKRLHPSVAKLEEEIVQFCTDKHRIRIDREGGKLRYASWKLNQSTLMPPSLVLRNGKGNDDPFYPDFEFKNKGFLYHVWVDRGGWHIQVHDLAQDKVVLDNDEMECSAK